MEALYNINVNQGNEVLGSGPSISVEESPRGTASIKDITKHMHLMNGLMPEKVCQDAVELFGETLIHLAAQGIRVPLFGFKGKRFCTIYMDLKLDRNISLADVQAIDPTITELTEDNAKQFVNPKDIKARLYFETEDGGNEALADELEGKKLNETHVKPLIRRKENQGGNGGSNGGGNNPDDNVLG